MESLKSSEPFFTRINHEGIVQYSTYNDLPNGWKVYLGMPSLERQIPMSDVVIFLITGGLALFSVGLYFSLVISRRISRPIIELAESARAIGKGEKPKHVETNIFEVNEVNDALINAAHERDLADEKARIAIELRDNFLSIASHELKTPLTSMNLQSQIISKMIENPDRMSLEKLHKSVTTINSQMKRLTRLIDDLLDISRITAGKLDINKEHLDLSLLTKEIVSYFEGVSKTSKITFIDSSVEGNFDRNRMEQVITNLVSNAIKYGDGNPISVEVSREQDFAVVKVKDNGIGIDPKDQNRIFERFERLVSNNDVSGLGLGLWIVHKIITQLEGKISVHSEGLGKGTTFTVKVPIN
jgi:signal transduction histidine kinase